MSYNVHVLNAYSEGPSYILVILRSVELNS